MSTKTLARLAAAAVIAVALALVAAACGSSKSSDASAARSAGASVTANPQFIQAKALVKHCFAGTPVQQYRQIKLVFLSSKTGTNGPEVVKARAATAGCMGISRSDEQPFFNDAVKAAEAQRPRLHPLHPAAWLTAYFGQTLPPVVIKYSNAPGLGKGTTTPSPAAATTGSPA